MSFYIISNSIFFIKNAKTAEKNSKPGLKNFYIFHFNSGVRRE